MSLGPTPYESTPPPRRKVHVRHRDDVGEIFDGGKNLGAGYNSIYAVGVYFPKTGECIYYEPGSVNYIDQQP